MKVKLLKNKVEGKKSMINYVPEELKVKLKGKEKELEKQEWKQENTDDLTDFENAMMHIGCSFFGNNAGLDPNNTSVVKEQAKLLRQLFDEEMKELLRTEYEKGKHDALVRQWSEEDKAIRNYVEELAFEGFKKDSVGNHLFTWAAIQNWLKLRQSTLSQPKQEWSEEDNAKRNALIGLIKEVKIQPLKRPEDWNGYISWLKSLSPQNTWKPSEDEIKTLELIRDGWQINADFNNTLYHLIEQLKILREE